MHESNPIKTLKKSWNSSTSTHKKPEEETTLEQQYLLDKHLYMNILPKKFHNKIHGLLKKNNLLEYKAKKYVKNIKQKPDERYVRQNQKFQEMKAFAQQRERI